jgi:hypothetical protein
VSATTAERVERREERGKAFAVPLFDLLSPLSPSPKVQA